MRTARMPDPSKKHGSPIKDKRRKENIEAARYPAFENQDSEHPSPSGEDRRLITNTDEQHHITNADSDALDEKEREGV